MAGFKSAYLANKFENWLFNNASMPTLPTALYFALYTAAPTASGGGTEVSGGSYARVAVTRNTTNFPTTTTQSVTNATAITFATATANWGTVLGVGILDNSSGGNLLAYGPLSASVAVPSGNTFSLPVTTGMTATEA